MEYHHNQYMSLEGKVKAMLDKQEFPAIFSVCVESFPHIVPAIQYRKKREITPETPDWSACDVICQYAPPLFEHAVIESLFEFVKSTRMLAKQDNVFLQTIDIAFEAEKVARVLWTHIEKQPGISQELMCKTLGFNPQTTINIIDIWELLGIINRRDDNDDERIAFSSRLDDEVSGVCQNCGVLVNGCKELFYRSFLCQQCGIEGYYHIKYSNSQ